MPARRAFALLLGLGVLAGCASGTDAARATTRPFTVGIGDSLGSLEPSGANFAEAELVIGLMFEGLTRLDSLGRAVPALAQRWTTTDQRVWTFTLRPGAAFHDGAPVRAADVVRSWQEAIGRIDTTDATLLQQALARATSGGTPVVQGMDSVTVRIVLDRPDAMLPRQLAEAEFWVRSARSTARAPIGTGPWRLVGVSSREPRLTFSRVDPAPGLLDTLLVRLTDPADDLGDQLGPAGSIDWTMSVGTRQYATLAPRAEVRLRSGLPTDRRQVVLARRRPALRDVRIRQAIAHAIDRRALLSARPGVPLEVAWGILPQHLLDQPVTSSLPYDPARARALLREAGYDSARTPILIGATPSTIADSTSELAWFVRNYLRAVGMRAELRAVEDAARARLLDDPAIDLDVEIAYVDVPTDVAVAGLSFRGLSPLDGLTPAEAARATEWSRRLEALAREPDVPRRQRAIAALGDSVESLVLTVGLWWQPPMFACSLRVTECPAQLLGNRFEHERIRPRAAR